MTTIAGLEIILTAVFATSAWTKARSFVGFVTLLHSPFRRFAPAVGAAVVAGEGVLAVGFGVASLHLLPVRPFGLGACLFLCLASAFIAYRLTAADSPACGCFGGGRPQPDSLHLEGRRGEKAGAVRMLLPGLYALRNGALFAGAWALGAQATVHLDYLALPETLATFLVCPLLIMVGATVSISLYHRQLSLSVHPLVSYYAPRLEPLLALGWYSNQSRPVRPPSAGAHPSDPSM